jgi:hypothetical protein
MIITTITIGSTRQALIYIGQKKAEGEEVAYTHISQKYTAVV